MTKWSFMAVVFVSVLAAAIAGCGGTPTESTTTDRDVALSSQARFERWIVQHREKHLAMEVHNPPVAINGGGSDPVPIPGGLGGGTFHTWLPGPVGLDLQGLDVDPSTINDYKGFSAIAYLAGTVTASDGKMYDMFHDMRIFQGKYIAEDGSNQHGSFAFI